MIYFLLSAHHGTSKGATSLSQLLLASGAGICKYLPFGQKYYYVLVYGSIKVFGSLFGLNQ